MALRREGAIRNPVLFNRDLMEWVLENLIKNGIDALKDGKGTITIRLEDVPDGGVVIRVVDTGSGIPLAVRQQDLRAGLHHQEARLGHGPGAGQADRDPVPWRPDPRRDDRPARHHLRHHAAGAGRPDVPYRILWIDDNIEDLRAHILYLGEKGYAVEGATNGRDGLAMLEAQNLRRHPAGRDDAGHGRPRDPRGHPPAQRARAGDHDHQERGRGPDDQAIGKRIDDYLVKPVSPLQILSALKRQLEARSHHRRAGHARLPEPLHGASATASRPPPRRRTGSRIYGDLVTWGLDLFAYSDHGLLETPGRADGRRPTWRSRKYVREHYRGWVNDAPGAAPLLSPDVYRDLGRAGGRRRPSRSSGS